MNITKEMVAEYAKLDQALNDKAERVGLAIGLYGEYLGFAFEGGFIRISFDNDSWSGDGNTDTVPTEYLWADEWLEAWEEEQRVKKEAEKARRAIETAKWEAEKREKRRADYLKLKEEFENE